MGVSQTYIKVMIRVLNYESPPIDRGEILRYMGCKEGDFKIDKLIDECLKEAESQLVYKVCYDVFDISPNCDLSSIRHAVQAENVENTTSSPNYDSKIIARNLEGCHSIVVFAATVGLGIDRLISKYSRISPVKALCFQAIGAERIESLCNFFNKAIAYEMSERCLSARPRFSPGYGDFSLEVQREIFKVLDCYRKIGLSLNDSLLMSPSKSVTAIIGFCKADHSAVNDVWSTNADINSCAYKNAACEASNNLSGELSLGKQNTCSTCDKTDCNFRRN